MLGKMMIHGLVAAILIGGAAAVYAQARDTATPVQADNGYLRPTADGGHGDGYRDRDGHRDRNGDTHRIRSERRADDHDHDRDGRHDRQARIGHDD